MEVYKYMPEERKDFFSSFRLRFTQPQALNDPYECLPAISNSDYEKLIEKAINSMNEKELSLVLPDLDNTTKNLKDKYEKTGNLEQLLIEIYKREINKRIGILCLSKRHDSVLMWSHYTDSHRGFLLGFDSNHHFFKKQDTDDAEIGDLREVKYSQDRPIISLNEIKVTTDLFEHKNIEWKYEQEMRLIRNLKNKSYVKEGQEHKIFLFDIPKECISSVIFGMECSPQLQGEIEDLINKDIDLKSVKLYKAEMDRKSYKIQTYELT